MQPKRKHPPDEDTEMTSGDASSMPEDASKLPKTDGAPPSTTQPAAGLDANGDLAVAAHAHTAAAYSHVTVRRRIGNVSSFWSTGAGCAIGFLPSVACPDVLWEVLDNILRCSITLGSTQCTDPMHEECDESEKQRE